MLKEFIEHIQKTTQPLITTVNGSTFRITDDGIVDAAIPRVSDQTEECNHDDER